MKLFVPQFRLYDRNCFLQQQAFYEALLISPALKTLLFLPQKSAQILF